MGTLRPKVSLQEPRNCAVMMEEREREKVEPNTQWEEAACTVSRASLFLLEYRSSHTSWLKSPRHTWYMDTQPKLMLGEGITHLLAVHTPNVSNHYLVYMTKLIKQLLLMTPLN